MDYRIPIINIHTSVSLAGTQVRSSCEPHPHLKAQQTVPGAQHPEHAQPWATVGRAVGLVCVCDDEVIMGVEVELVGIGEATVLLLEGQGTRKGFVPLGSQTRPLSQPDIILSVSYP